MCGVRTRSMVRGSATISFAPWRRRRFICEANTGWPSVGIRADHENHVRLHHRIEVLRARRLAERVLQAIAGGRMAHARAGVDVVVAEAGAHELLHEVGLLVGAARGGDAADGVAAVLGLNALQLGGRIGDRLLPGDLAPGVGDLLADHRLQDAVRVGRIADREAPLDAGVAVIGVAVEVRHHAHDFLALHLGAERAADAAIGAGRGDAVLRLALLDERLLRQRGGRAGLHAGAARHALGVHEGLVLARGHLGVEAASLDGQREGALLLIAGTHAARADDALARRRK